MIKILQLTSYYYPEKAASSYLRDNRDNAFAKAGFEIVVYTPVPSRGVSSEERNRYKEHKKELLHDGKMVVFRFPLFGESQNPIIRAFRYFLSCLIQLSKGLFAMDAKRCNIMFITSTPPIQGAMAALIKTIRHIPFIYNLQDIFPDSLVATGLAKKGSFLWKVGRIIENFTYKHADKIIVISEDFKKNIMAKGVPEDKIVVIYNWVDEKRIVPVDKNKNPFYRKFGLDKDKFRIVYAGNLGYAQNIDVIIDTASRLKERKDIEFVIFGSGGLEVEIKKQLKDKDIKNVKIFPLQPADEVSCVYSLGDLCIVSCKAGFGGSAMPSKTWSILSTARPVLANFDEGELKRLLEDNNCGFFTPAGDVDAMVSVIEEATKNPTRCDEMGIKGRQFILSNLTKEKNTKKYVDVIKEIVENKYKASTTTTSPKS